MPITVNCSCGKIFKVKDELKGQNVACQVCGANVLVQEQALSQPALVMKPTVPAPAGDTIACPACAESIPSQSRICPFCKETIRKGVTDSEREEMLKVVRESLAAHHQSADESAKGGTWSIGTFVIGAITLLCLMGFVAGVMQRRNGEGLVALGLLFGIPFGIGLIVALIRDHQSAHIQDAQSADLAFKRFFNAISSGRKAKAYVALAPSARKGSNEKGITFNNKKIPHTGSPGRWSDANSFQAFWKSSVFGGSGSHNRTLAFKSARVVKTLPDGVAIVEAKIGVTSYNGLLWLTILISLWLAIILIYCLQQKDELTIRKALIRHEGQWYVLNGSWESDLDRALA